MDFELAMAYRNVFSSEEGRQVLTSILLDLGYFGASTTQEEMTLANYGGLLLHRIGILQDFNIRGIVDRLLTLPIEQPQGDE